MTTEQVNFIIKEVKERATNHHVDVRIRFKGTDKYQDAMLSQIAYSQAVADLLICTFPDSTMYIDIDSINIIEML